MSSSEVFTLSQILRYQALDNKEHLREEKNKVSKNQ